MPISELNFRRLEQTLESGQSSKYIPKLMKGNSVVKPNDFSDKQIYDRDSHIPSPQSQTHRREIPCSPKKFLSYLND